MKMKKKSLLAMTLILVFALMLVVPTCVTSVKTQKYIANFHCQAKGECIVVTKFIQYGEPGGGYSPSEFMNGNGKVAFAGSAKVDKQLPNDFIPVTFYYRNNGIEAGGSMSASWGGQSLRLELTSNGDAGGIFIDENLPTISLTDTFAAGFGPGTGFVSYKGTYKNSTGTYKIHGNATVQAGVQLSTILIQVTLYKPDNTPLFWVIWVETDLPSPINLDAADHFARSVKITK